MRLISSLKLISWRLVSTIVVDVVRYSLATRRPIVFKLIPRMALLSKVVSVLVMNVVVIVVIPRKYRFDLTLHLLMLVLLTR